MTYWQEKTDFWRYRPVICLWGASCATMGTIFAVPVFLGGSPVTPDLYGPTVYAIPALVWCAFQIFAGILVMVGATARIPLIAAVGLTLLALEFFGFGLFGALQTQGGVVVSGAIGVFWPTSSIYAWSAWRARRGGE